MLPERGEEARAFDNVANRAAVLAVRVGEQGWTHAELAFEPRIRSRELGRVLFGRQNRHMGMGFGLAAYDHARRRHLSDPVPAHVVAVPPVDRSRRDEQGQGQTGLSKPGPAFRVERQERIVDAQPYRSVRQVPTFADRGHDVRQGKDGEPAAREQFDMRFELGDRGVGRWMGGLAETVVHEDDGRIRGKCGRRQIRNYGGKYEK